MSNVIQCEKCGATCNLKDGFCKKCWAQLPGAEDYILDGMGQTDLEDFIDKNSKRYIDVYKKNQGKKMFLNINWAAMFFGVNWMLYRKMYKLASLLYIAILVIPFVLNIVFLIPQSEKIANLNNDIAAFESYLASGGESILMDSDGVPYSPEVVKKGANAERTLTEMVTNVSLKTSAFTLLTCWLFFGLFGDAVYKMHIIKNIKRKDKGGVSLPAALGVSLLLGLLNSLIISPLLSFVIKILFV